jgi:hypothetical protein
MSVAKAAHHADHCCMSNRLRTSVIAASVAAAALAVGAPSASAGLLVASGTDCKAQPTTQAFAAYGDGDQYELAPGGDFGSKGPNWTMTGRASETNGQLRLPPGASAQSPVMCVGIEKPTVRFFAKSSTPLLSTMTVDATIQTSLGLKVSVPFGVMLPSGQLKPSPKFYVLVNLLPLLPGEQTPVQFRVTSVGLATWTVDNFYVDPRCH